MLRSIPCYANMLIMLNIFKKQQLCYEKLFKFDKLPTEYNRKMVDWKQTYYCKCAITINYDVSKATNISLP